MKNTPTPQLLPPFSRKPVGPCTVLKGYSDQNHFVQRFTFVRQDIIIPSLKSAEDTEVSGIADVKRPSGGREGHAGRVIPHYVGPATLLRHSLPAHPFQPLNLCGFNQSILNFRSSCFRPLFPARFPCKFPLAGALFSATPCAYPFLFVNDQYRRARRRFLTLWGSLTLWERPSGI